MAKYIMREVRSVKDGKKVKYPKLLIQDRVTLRDIAQEVARGTTFAAEEIEGIVGSVAEVMGRLIGQGCSVKIERVGTFSGKLSLRQGVEREQEEGTKRNAASLVISGVNFKPAGELLSTANRNCTLKREQANQYTSARHGRDERLAAAVAFLAEHPVLTTRNYCALTGLERTAAGRELALLAREGQLSVVGYKTHRVYTLPKGEQ